MSASKPQRRVALITREACHLCEVAERELLRLQAELGFELTTSDVAADPALLAEYSDRVPVIFIDDREHGYWRLEEGRFRAALAGDRSSSRWRIGR
jgi:glutaredoxin